jgi:hypothetical protein
MFGVCFTGPCNVFCETKAVVHAVLLYGSETSAMTTQMTNKVEVFDNRCATSITGQHIRPNTDGTWHYSNTQETPVHFYSIIA